MTATYLLYAKAGKEFEVTEALQDMAIDAWCGRVIQWRRSGKKRTPDPVEVPALPNYIWATMSPYQYYEAQKIKHLARKVMGVTYSAERGLKRFMAFTDAAYAQQKRAVESANVPFPEFDTGEAIKVIGGKFAEQVFSFREAVFADDPQRRKIKADGPFGTVLLDPLDVKAAE